MQSIPLGMMAAMFAIIVLGCVVAVISRKGKPLSPIFISFALMAVLVCAFLAAFFLTQAPFLQYIFAVLVIAIPFVVFVIVEKAQSHTTKADKESRYSGPVPNGNLEIPSFQPFVPHRSYAGELDFEPIVDEVPYTQPNEEMPFESQIEELPIEDDVILEPKQPNSAEKPVWRKLSRDQLSQDSSKSYNPLSNLPPKATGCSNESQSDSADSAPIENPETPFGATFNHLATTKSTDNGFDSFGSDDMGIEEVSDYIVRDTETRRQNSFLDDGFEIEEPEYIAVNNKEDIAEPSHNAQSIKHEQPHSQIVIESTTSNELDRRPKVSTFEEPLPPQETLVQEPIVEPKPDYIADEPKEPKEYCESPLLIEDSQGPKIEESYTGKLNLQDNATVDSSSILNEAEEQFAASEPPNLIETDASYATPESLDSASPVRADSEDVQSDVSSAPDSPGSPELQIDTYSLTNDEEDETPSSPEEQAKPKEIEIDDLIQKADSFRDKGMPDLAARFYREAASKTNKSSLARSLRFTELNCYVKAGNVAMVNELANELRSSSVLTKAERMKLQAVERFRK